MRVKYKFEKKAVVPLGVEELFKFHTNIYNICAMVPGYIKIKVLAGSDNLKGGDSIKLRISVAGFSFIWESVIEEFVPNDYFTDRMITGPFKSWRHKHVFQKINDETLITDIVDYSLPWGFLGTLAEMTFVRGILENIFVIRYNFESRACHNLKS